eukprot:s2179_g5.t1
MADHVQVDPSRVEYILQLRETPCEESSHLNDSYGTHGVMVIMVMMVGPFTVHPTTVPANATVRFAMTGLFSAYEAQYCRFRMTWPNELGYPMQLPSTLLAKGVTSSDMQRTATRKKRAPAWDEMTLLRFGVQILSTMEVFVRPSLEPESSNLAYVRGASADQTLLISFGSTGQLPVSILPCMIQMGWSSVILCEAEEAFYAADLRCSVPTNSSWILQSPQLQCAGSGAGYSPIEEPYLPVSDIALPMVTSQSVHDLHVDAADLLRAGLGAAKSIGSCMSPSLAMAGPRLTVKQRGRPSASEALRARCLEQARANRDALFEKMRGQNAGDFTGILRESPEYSETLQTESIHPDLRSLVREVVLDSREMEGWLDEESALALEEEIYAELCEEEKRLERLAQEELELLEEQQNAEDAALYEQHLLGGVCCPLCGLGRLEVKNGELLCSKCELQVQLMDEEMCLEQISEFLYLTERRHDEACAERGKFETSDSWGQNLLQFRCKKCGWNELVF